ncbi:hypothetical protein NCCP2495_32340 [Dietzia sp. NCCP-2495]|uniref:vWA domain-containing protein n=1 Tax=Dietzia sp. NCCP-2495 TaxID=2934675 RepID=UPI00222F7F72|nr:VWA domain-containing protein [Dietzia sp. NCCP-2495]GLB65354.1 hypothetical protein NCCP2495_32340 [Dietzia sp. NCCP-2495]
MRVRRSVKVWWVIAAVIALVVAVLPQVGPTAWAQGDAGGSTTTTPSPSAGQAAGAADAELAIIMDASSSMLQPDEGGTRLDVAKRAATDLVDSLPDIANVGMLAYGTQVSDAPENHERGCAAIRELAPVGAVDKDRLRGEIDGLEARGYTPIGNSLRAAADMLSPDAADRSIVLVSDGIDTCAPPPPCEVAAELADEGVGLAVHVVGFRADEATRAELECIAGATGGTYRQADDAAALSESLQFLAQRAIVEYETTGTEFQFADTPDDALYVGQGLYRTTVQTVSELNTAAVPEKFLRVAVPEGHRAYVAVTALPRINLTDTGGGEGINVRLTSTNESDADCTNNSVTAQTSGGGWEPPESTVLAFAGQEPGDECDGTQFLVAAQFNTAGLGTAEELEVEMSVQFEPMPGNEVGTWPEGHPGSAPDAAPVEISGPQPVAGGNSFANAAEITEGSFSDAIVPGEFRYYRVPVQWGQRPVVTVGTGPSARGEVDTLHAALFDPVRRDVASEHMSSHDDTADLTLTADRPVNFTNRDANLGGERVSIAGEHYLAVSMNVSGTGPTGVEQPFEFAVRMDGEPGEGPDWAPVNEPGPTPSASPIGFDGAAPDGDATGGASDSNENNDDNASAAAAPEDSGLPGWALPAGIGVVLLIIAGLGLWFFSRGKSSR